jgi:hypothetical protein
MNPTADVFLLVSFRIPLGKRPFLLLECKLLHPSVPTIEDVEEDSTIDGDVPWGVKLAGAVAGTAKLPDHLTTLVKNDHPMMLRIGHIHGPALVNIDPLGAFKDPFTDRADHPHKRIEDDDPIVPGVTDVDVIVQANGNPERVSQPPTAVKLGECPFYPGKVEETVVLPVGDKEITVTGEIDPRRNPDVGEVTPGKGDGVGREVTEVDVKLLNPTVLRIDGINTKATPGTDVCRLVELFIPPAKPSDFGDEPSVRVKLLDSIVPRVGDIDRPDSIDRESPGVEELPGVRTRLTEREEVTKVKPALATDDGLLHFTLSGARHHADSPEGQ